MRGPWTVLVAACAVCAAVVLAAGALAGPLGAALSGVSPGVVEAAFATLLYSTLAVAALVGRRLGGVRGGAPIAWAWVAAGAAIGLGGLAAATGYAALAGGVARGGAGWSAAAILLGTAVVVGSAAAEELFFRGWVQPVLARAWGPAAAIGVTAAAFAALHVAGGARGGVTLVNLALGGVVFGLLAWRSGGLAAPIAAHGAWNWAEIVGLGLSPNPGAGAFGALHDLELTGAALWGGSDEGLNASVAMTIVLAAIVVPLALRAVSDRSKSPSSP